ncbi:MAG: DUF1343 domain-containing protein [Candidatus Marinimicrobia bacterium]|nr:DUF1343 domain-containing protein [Candidatus Neomarinimicrobiota bacterium]
MKLYIIHIINVILFVSNFLFAVEFEHTRILQLPDLDFYPGVLTGLDILEEMDFEPLSDRKIAVLTNQTAVNTKGIHLLDLLNQYKNKVTVTLIYTPEFGLFAQESEHIHYSKEENDLAFGIPVKSLWGEKFKPEKDDIQDLDLILIDLQDPGIRYFSFITTVTKVMEVASLYDIPVIVLDRPNPLGGVVIEGPTVRPKYQSFIGYHLVPIRHGLTIGEYCLLINETGWIRQGFTVDLTIIPMANWRRSMLMDDTGFPWVNPAPDIDNLMVLHLALGMGLLEGTNLSYGLGTGFPYQIIGAPWVDSEVLMKSLHQYNLTGVTFKKIEFIPDSTSIFNSYLRYKGEQCEGVKIEVTNSKDFSPLTLAITILSVTTRLYPHQFQWVRNNYIDQIFGHDYLRIFLAQERNPLKLTATWTHDIIKFSQFREKYLLYR